MLPYHIPRSILVFGLLLTPFSCADQPGDQIDPPDRQTQPPAVTPAGDDTDAEPDHSPDPQPPRTRVQKSADPFPDEWFYPDRRTGRRAPMPKSLEGKPAPALHVKKWFAAPRELDELRGKVVVVDFWATWCPPCMQAIPKNIQLVEKYGENDLAFIGVHDSHRGVHAIPDVIRGYNINYAVAVDDNGKSVRAWRLAFWPTYVILDRRGIVRAAGLMPHHVEDVVKALLAEPVDN